MTRTNKTKKITALTLAVMIAFMTYMPVSTYATEIPDQETVSSEAVEKTEAPKVEQQSEEVSAAPAVEEEQISEEADEPMAFEEENAAQESNYGEATMEWGYGNDTKTVRWDAYQDGKDYVLVFKLEGESTTDVEKAITQLLDENGQSVKEALKNKVTKVVIETGITGIGWTALYSDKDYEPLYYGDEYTVDRNKTDVFKGFSKLTTVIPAETLKRIGWSAFRQCYKLSEFDFTKCPELEEIMNQAFHECKALNNVDLSNCNNLMVIAWSAFNGSGKGSDVTLVLPTNGSLTTIGGNGFNGFGSNSASIEVDFSGVASSVTQILKNAFYNANLVGEIVGFVNLEVIGKDALKGSSIVYIPYVAPEEEPASEEPKEEPAVEEPAVEEPTVEEPAVEEEEIITADADVQDETAPVAVKAVTTAKAGNNHVKAAKARVHNDRNAETFAATDVPTTINSEAAPTTVLEDENAAESSTIIYLFGAMIVLAALALTAVIARRKSN